MAREVFAARGDPRRLELGDDHASELGDELDLVAERAVADCRVGRVGQHIEHGCVIERDADRRQLLCQRAREPPRQLGAPRSAERDHRRPFGERPLQSRDAAALLVDGHPRRQSDVERLDLARDLADLIGIRHVPFEQDHAADRELARERLELDGQLRAVESGDQQLSDLLPKGDWGHVWGCL